MRPDMEIPEAAIEAAIATSSRAPLRNAEEAESYRKRVTQVLQAALPALREQMRRNFEAGLGDPSEGLTGDTIDDVLRIFDEELGDSHAQD